MVWFWGTWGLSSPAGGRPPTPALEGEVLAAGPLGSPGALVFGFLLLRTVVASSSCVWAPSPFCLSLPIASLQRPSLMARPHPGPLLPHPATLPTVTGRGPLAPLVSPRGRGLPSAPVCAPGPGLASHRPPAPRVAPQGELVGWRSSSLTFASLGLLVLMLSLCLPLQLVCSLASSTEWTSNDGHLLSYVPQIPTVQVPGPVGSLSTVVPSSAAAGGGIGAGVVAGGGRGVWAWRVGGGGCGDSRHGEGQGVWLSSLLLGHSYHRSCQHKGMR